MSKHRQRSSSNNGEILIIPARSAILDYLLTQGVPKSLSDFLTYFDVPQDQHSDALLARLARMLAAGLIIKNRKNYYCLAEKLNLVTGTVIGHADGFGFVRVDGGGDDCFLHYREMRRVLHGDRVLARVQSSHSKNKLEGKIIEVLETEGREIVGRFHRRASGGFVEPDDARYARDILIADKSRGRAVEGVAVEAAAVEGAAVDGVAVEGDVVVVKITEHPVQRRDAVGEIVEVLGKVKDAGMEAEIALRKHEIPHQWPAAVQAQIKALSTSINAEGGLDGDLEAGRKDLRNLPLVTIDGDDARDFDDAVFAMRSQSGWKLYVAIADVSHYVAANSALDLEAFQRGTSVYFPRRVIPMLPEVLSNGICSLNPDEDRLAMICEMDFNLNGERERFEFYPAVIRSHARLTYEDVQEIQDNPNDSKHAKYKSLFSHLNELYALFRVLRALRGARGAIDFEMPEPRFAFDQDNKISAVFSKNRLDSHILIEECMLAANECAAEFLKKHFGDKAIYRNHDGPETEPLKNLREFLKSLGLSLGGGEDPTATDYSNLVKNLGNRVDIAVLVQSALLRSLSQARYSNECGGHFALSYEKYTHFTSPIRRYSDLVVHRLIKSKVGANANAQVCGDISALPGPNATTIEAISVQCSQTERRAENASNDVIRWLKAEFMSDKIGMTFSGRISGVKDFGIFVMLDDFFIDGLIHVSALGSDYFEYDRGRMELEGSRNGRRFKLGDQIQISVVNVDIDQARIDFELAENSHKEKKPQKRKPQKKGSQRNRPQRNR